MSKLKELIEQLCPDGVEYKLLGDFAECFSGATPKKKVEEYWENGAIPWMSSGEVHQRVVRSVEGYITEAGYKSCSTRMVPAGTVVVALAGQGKTRGCVAITAIELCTNQSLGAILPDDTVESKFLFYYLDTQYQYLRQISSGEGTRGGLNMPMLRELRIPAPPIEVQREIVRILDSMQELDDVLSEEHALITERVNVLRAMIYGTSKYPLIALGGIGKFERGRRFTRAEMGGAGVGCIHYGDIYTEYGFYATEPVNRLDENIDKNLRYASKGDVIVAATSENAEDVCTAMAWLGEEGVAIHDDCQRFRHDQNPLYMAMFFNSEPFARQKQRFITESKVVRIAGDEMAQIEIPLPPLEKQNEIADGMMAHLELLNAIEEELEARRKQFEYYRDRLLDFPEKVA